MKSFRIIRDFLSFIILFIFFYQCTSTSKPHSEPDEKLYLAHNIWIDNKYRALSLFLRLGSQETKDLTGQVTTISSTNYKTGVLIGAGTELDDLAVSSNEIKFRIKKLSLAVTCKIDRKLESATSGKELFDRMITKKDFNALTSGISERYIEAIKSGVVIEGMPKEAVIIALGFPTSHSNSNLDSDSWVYWRTKYNTIEVQFDSVGLAIQNVIP